MKRGIPEQYERNVSYTVAIRLERIKFLRQKKMWSPKNLSGKRQRCLDRMKQVTIESVTNQHDRMDGNRRRSLVEAAKRLVMSNRKITLSCG